jgi:hypothetical protein
LAIAPDNRHYSPLLRPPQSECQPMIKIPALQQRTGERHFSALAAIG